MSSARKATAIVAPRLRRKKPGARVNFQEQHSEKQTGGTVETETETETDKDVGKNHDGDIGDRNNGSDDDDGEQEAKADEALPLASFCFIKKPNISIPSNSTIMEKSQIEANKDKDTDGANNPDADGDAGTAAAAAAGPAVQIIDGEIVLQESSLVVTGKRRSIQEVEAEYQHVVEEDTQLAIVNASYTSFKTRNSNSRWSVDETENFYKALRQLGTDFSAMESFFVNRNRKQLKKKYMTELKKNPKLIDMALNPRHRIKVDLSVFDVTVTKADVKRVTEELSKPVSVGDIDTGKTDNGSASRDGNAEDDNNDKTNANGTINEDELEVVEEDDNDNRYDDIFGDKDPSQEESNTWNEAPEAKEESFFPEANEPSMDEFFGESEMDVGMDGPAETGGGIDSGMDLGDGIEPEPQMTLPAEEVAPAISLVPRTSDKKKSKRPKFRSVVRKRK